MSDKILWDNKHIKYSTEEWIDVPTIFAKQVIKYFPKGAKILDLGAGQGQDSRYFVKNGFDVVSTDFSDEANRLSQEKALHENLNFKIEKLDLTERFPFDNEIFDIVYIHLSLQFWNKEKTAEILDEIVRVLKTKGLLASMFNTIDDPEVKKSRLTPDGCYMTPSGLTKSFYTVDDIANLTTGVFEPIILDSKGETHKDEVKTLIRFLGIKRF